MRISDWSSDVCSSDLVYGVEVIFSMVEKHDLAGPQGCKLAHQFAADRPTSARHHDPAPTDGLAHDGLVELQLRPVEQICEVQELQGYGACSTMLKSIGCGRRTHTQAQSIPPVHNTNLKS